MWFRAFWPGILHNWMINKDFCRSTMMKTRTLITALALLTASVVWATGLKDRRLSDWREGKNETNEI